MIFECLNLNWPAWIPFSNSGEKPTLPEGNLCPSNTVIKWSPNKPLSGGNFFFLFSIKTAFLSLEQLRAAHLTFRHLK